MILKLILLLSPPPPPKWPNPGRSDPPNPQADLWRNGKPDGSGSRTKGQNQALIDGVRGQSTRTRYPDVDPQGVTPPITQ